MVRWRPRRRSCAIDAREEGVGVSHNHKGEWGMGRGVVKLMEPQQFAHAKSVKRPARGVGGDAAAYPLSAGLGDGMDVSCCI